MTLLNEIINKFLDIIIHPNQWDECLYAEEVNFSFTNIKDRIRVWRYFDNSTGNKKDSCRATIGQNRKVYCFIDFNAFSNHIQTYLSNPHKLTHNLPEIHIPYVHVPDPPLPSIPKIKRLYRQDMLLQFNTEEDYKEALDAFTNYEINPKYVNSENRVIVISTRYQDNIYGSFCCFDGPDLIDEIPSHNLWFYEKENQWSFFGG